MITSHCHHQIISKRSNTTHFSRKSCVMAWTRSPWLKVGSGAASMGVAMLGLGTWLGQTAHAQAQPEQHQQQPHDSFLPLDEKTAKLKLVRSLSKSLNCFQRHSYTPNRMSVSMCAFDGAVLLIHTHMRHGAGNALRHNTLGSPVCAGAGGVQVSCT